MSPAKPRPRWQRWALEIAIFIVLLVAFQMWQLRDTAQGPAPAIKGQLLTGEPFDLAAWQAGRPALIYFWAEWCPVCKTTAGSVSNLAEDWPVISIATQSGDAAAVQRVMTERGYRWPTVPDPDGRRMKDYRLPGVPGFVILAPNGDIRFVTLGYTSEIGLRLRLWWAGR